jgi:outer membrane lipoprotein carrier protein
MKVLAPILAVTLACAALLGSSHATPLAPQLPLHSLHSAPSLADPIVKKLEARYRHASTLKAAFFERYSDGNGGVSAESGTVYFSRPSRMRWEYKSPQEKLFLVDGSNVWFYVPADKTASRATMKGSSDWRTPLALLTGKADFARLCKSVEVVDPFTAQNPEDKPSAADHSVLRCIPQSAAGDEIREVILESDPEARLVRLIVRQPGNLETEFRFGAWEENIAINELKFHFDPPPDVTITDEQSLADSIH